jgi:hypothetical protein
MFTVCSSSKFCQGSIAYSGQDGFIFGIVVPVFPFILQSEVPADKRELIKDVAYDHVTADFEISSDVDFCSHGCVCHIRFSCRP